MQGISNLIYNAIIIPTFIIIIPFYGFKNATPLYLGGENLHKFDQFVV